MTNRKGPDWESALTKYLRGESLDAERLTKTGKEDEGDIVVKDGGIVIIEAKNEKRIDLAAYVREAELEAKNYAKHRGLDPNDITPVAVVKRRNHGAGQAYVVMTVDTFFDIGK